MPPRREARRVRDGNQTVGVDPVPFAREFVAALVESNLLNQVPRVTENNRAMEAMREFRRLDPPKFNGEDGNHIIANHWLAEIRKLFDALMITEDDLRVRLVACQLTGEANEWWQSILEARKDTRRAARAANQRDEQDKENMTWNEFETLFESQYFPDTYREQLRYQFERLEQGDMAVSDYVIRFQTLSRFAPELVRSEERKCRRFEKGLHESIKRLVVSRQIGRFSEIVECARSVELADDTSRDVEVRELTQQTIRINSSSGSVGNQGSKRQREQYSSVQGEQSSKTPTVPRTFEVSSRHAVVCYRCHQSGHRVTDCPQRGKSRDQRPPRICFRCRQPGHLSAECPNPALKRGALGPTGSGQTREV